jgi:hypothetical protein
MALIWNYEYCMTFFIGIQKAMFRVQTMRLIDIPEESRKEFNVSLTYQ